MRHRVARSASSVVRFLEHARVIAFRRGGEWEVGCGSADGMPRGGAHDCQRMRRHDRGPAAQAPEAAGRPPEQLPELAPPLGAVGQ